MIHQLRIYELRPHNRDAFRARFHGRCVPIMARHGFSVLATWETESATRCEFVYLLAWPDAATMDATWWAFLADPEWIEAKRVTHAAHGPLVGAIEDRVLTPVGSSAAEKATQLA